MEMEEEWTVVKFCFVEFDISEMASGDVCLDTQICPERSLGRVEEFGP